MNIMNCYISSRNCRPKTFYFEEKNNQVHEHNQDKEITSTFREQSSLVSVILSDKSETPLLNVF